MRRVFLLVLVLGACAVMVGGALAALPPGGSFGDDDGNIHEGNIEAIAAEGITRGCNPPTNDRYCPSNTLTRGQMAAFLVRALHLEDRLDNPFWDDDESIFEADIERLAAAGITRGCNPPVNDRYCPDSKVTRGQMAAFLVRAMGYEDAGGGDLFTDDDGSVFEADIDRLGTAEVTKGCNPPTNDRYCPDSPVLRDQMASFLSRALGLAPITPPPPTSSTTSTTYGGTPTTTLPDVLPPDSVGATFMACDTDVPGDEFSLDQRCVEAAVYNSTWANALYTDFYYRWLGPDGQPVVDCTTPSCKIMDFHYNTGFLVGWSNYFYVDGENRSPGWYSYEIWAGPAFSDPQDLLLRESFRLSAISPVPTTTTTSSTTTTSTTTTIPAPPTVSWDCTVGTDGVRTCAGNTDTLDSAVEQWSCAPDLHTSDVWWCEGDIDKRQAGQESWYCDGDYCTGDVDTTDPDDEDWSRYPMSSEPFFGGGDIDKDLWSLDGMSRDEVWECGESATGLACQFDDYPWSWTCDGTYGGNWSCSGSVGRLAPIVGPVPMVESDTAP